MALSGSLGPAPSGGEWQVHALEAAPCAMNEDDDESDFGAEEDDDMALNSMDEEEEDDGGKHRALSENLLY